MSLSSDLRCPRASLETEARAKLSEETSEYASGLVVTEASRSGLLPAERRLLERSTIQGPLLGSVLSNPSLQSKKFFLESKSHFICPVLKKENKEQVPLPLYPETLTVPLGLSQTPPIWQGCRLALAYSSRTGARCPVGKTRRLAAASLGGCEN